MKQSKTYRANYIKNAKTSSEDSMAPQNLFKGISYTNKNIKFMEESKLGLKIYESYITSMFWEELIERSSIQFISVVEEKKYRYRPEILSNVLYGSTLYWHILMSINGYTSKEEFVGFKKLLIPSLGVLQTIGQEIEKNKLNANSEE